MYVLVSNTEYGVLARSKKEAIKKFKRDLGLDVKSYMIRKVW